MKNRILLKIIVLVSLSIGLSAAPDHGSLKLERECQKGVASACTKTGLRISFGAYGYVKDYKKSAQFFQQGCLGSDWQGCHELAILYEFGRAGVKDLKLALKNYETACNGKYGNSCAAIGDLYKKGKGMPADEVKASEYYQKACEAGVKTYCKRNK
jgi:hypothetical protein